MDERTVKAQHVTEKETWSEPKAEWVKPQLDRLDEHKAAGKGSVIMAETTPPYAAGYGPS